MKPFIFILAFFFLAITAKGNVCDTVPAGVPQTFGGKYYEFKNYLLVDSFIMNSPGDTANIPYFPSLKFKASNNRWYAWDRTKWQLFLVPTDPTLQMVTTNGNKTTDTIITAGLRTKVILADTLKQPDFEFEVFPDIQGMTSDVSVLPQWYSMANWVATNKTSKNIQAVLTLGDITEWNNAFGPGEYEHADTGFKQISNAGIPFIIIPGNHDYGNILARNTNTFNNFFGVNYYAGKSWYGSAFHNRTENQYIKFDVEGMKFLVIGLEFIPTDSAMDWAQRVVDSFPDRKVILLTHAYITTFGERSKDTSIHSTLTYGLDSNYSNCGQRMWDGWLKKWKNLSLVIGGHFIQGTRDTGGIKKFTDIGDNGNMVHQIFVNYQWKGINTYPTASGFDGEGYFLRMRFSPSSSKIYASMFSPFLNTFDPLVDSFYLGNPAIEIKGNVAFKDNAYHRGEVRFDSSVFLATQKRYGITYTGLNGQISTNDSLKYYDTVNKSKLYFNGKLGIRTDSAKFDLDVNGNIGLSSDNYPSFFTTLSNRPKTQIINRSTPGLLLYGANAVSDLTMFRSQNANAATPATIGVGNGVGIIRFKAYTLDLSNITTVAAFRAEADTVNSSTNAYGGSFYWALQSPSGGVPDMMRLDHWGNLRLGVGNTFCCGMSGNTEFARLNVLGNDATAGVPDNVAVLFKHNWSTVTGTPTVLRINAGGTAGAEAALADFQYSSVSKFRVRKDGYLESSGYGSGSSFISNDTTNSPAAFDASGNIVRMVGWPNTISSNNYIQNQTASSQSAGFNITGNGIMGSALITDTLKSKVGVFSNVAGYRPLYEGNIPALLNVIHGSGNFGFAVTRASNDAGSANMVLYHTTSSAPSTPAPSFAGMNIGRVAWMGIDSGNTIRTSAEVRGSVDSVTTSNIWGSLRFFTGSATLFTEKLRIDHYGKVGIGITTPKELLHVAGNVMIGDTLKTPNIVIQIDTALYKPEAIDANGNHFKMAGWPSVGVTVLRGTLSSFTFPSLSTNTSTTTTVTITGAAVGDIVQIATTDGSAFGDGEFYDARVSGADTITIRRSNTTDSTMSSGTKSFNILVFKY